MRGILRYQRVMGFELPVGVEAGEVPVWTWPVGLSDGRVMVTLLYAGTGRGRTVVVEVSAAGESRVWGPGVGYPAPVIFYANGRDELVGLDLVKVGKLYACKVDGTHLWTLETSIRMETAVAPRSFLWRGEELFWRREDGVGMGATLVEGVPMGIREVEAGEEVMGEVRLPYVHLTGEGSLFVFEVEGGVRMTRYDLQL
jgi:hypothetical protein